MRHAPVHLSTERVRRAFVAPTLALLTVVSVLFGSPPAASAETAEAPAPLASALDAPDFRPIAPARLADSRPGRSTVDGAFRGTGRVTPTKSLRLRVTGRGGVPSTGVAAVTLNVTVTDPTAPGYLTVHQSGVARPNASNVNFERGATVANAVTVAPGVDGQVVLHASGPTHVVVDVSGYFTAGGIDSVTPARLADTRAGRSTVDGTHAGRGPVTPTARLDVQVTGRGGVPAGATAVALNVTATGSASQGYLTVYPTGSARPTASNLNFVKGQTVANSVVAKVGTGGRVSVHGSAPRAHVVVDVAGYFTAGADYVPLTPARVADTRPTGTAVRGPWYASWRRSVATGPIGGSSSNGAQLDVLVADRGSVPITDTGAVVLNVTVTAPSASGYLTVFPLDTRAPSTSSVNFRAGQTVANLVVMPLGRGGGISIRSSVPRTHVVVDVLGAMPGWSTADESGVWSSIARDVIDMPVTYDRCYSIPYKINAGNVTGDQRDEWIDDVHAAADQIEAATGIEFVDQGLSTDPPVDLYEQPYPYDYTLVAFTSPTVVPDLAGSVLGIGGSIYGGISHPVRWIPEQFWAGFAYLDAGEAMQSGYGEGLSFGQVALHELAHVVGLGHVTNSEELMNASAIFRSGYFGRGDLHGLSLLYRTQSCPGSPATFAALSRGAGKPMPEGIEHKVVTSHDHDHSHS